MTTPTTHRITPSCQPVFPCWLWKAKPIQCPEPLWLYFNAMPEWCTTVPDLVEAGSYTHFSTLPRSTVPKAVGVVKRDSYCPHCDHWHPDGTPHAPATTQATEYVHVPPLVGQQQAVAPTQAVTEPLSKCCHGTLEVVSANEGTSHHVCNTCGLPADAVGDGPVAEPAPTQAPSDWPNDNGRTVDASGSAIDHYFATVTPEQLDADLKKANFGFYNKIGRVIATPSPALSALAGRAATEWIGDAAPDDAEDATWRKCDIDDLTAILLRTFGPAFEKVEQALATETAYRADMARKFLAEMETTDRLTAELAKAEGERDRLNETMAAFYKDMENALGERRVASHIVAYDIKKAVDDLARFETENAQERHRYSELHVTCTALEKEADGIRSENAALRADKEKSDADMREARIMLAVSHSGTALYHDDGELQDNREQPFIDWKRDSITDIKAKLTERLVKALDSTRNAKEERG